MISASEKLPEFSIEWAEGKEPPLVQQIRQASKIPQNSDRDSDVNTNAKAKVWNI